MAMWDFSFSKKRGGRNVKILLGALINLDDLKAETEIIIIRKWNEIIGDVLVNVIAKTCNPSDEILQWWEM